MKKTKRLFVASAGFWLAGFVLVFMVSGLSGQQSSAPEQKAWTTAEDHQNMMQQLGIMKLRPGPSGREGQPNQANYDEAMANPFPNLPEVLKLKNARKSQMQRRGGSSAVPKLWRTLSVKSWDASPKTSQK